MGIEKKRKIETGHYAFMGHDILLDVHTRTWHAFLDGARVETRGPRTLGAVCKYIARQAAK